MGPINISKGKYHHLFLFVFHSSLHFTSVNGDGWRPPQLTTDFCRNPVPSPNPVNLEWLVENVKSGWNIQFGNPLARNLISNFLNGFGNANNKKLAHHTCPRLTFGYADNSLFKGLYTSGKGNIQAPFSCARGDSGLGCLIRSSDGIGEVTSRDYISYVDGRGRGDHNLASVVKCFSNGQVMWYAMTVSNTINAEDTATILEHFRSIGLNPDTRVQISCQRHHHGWSRHGGHSPWFRRQPGAVWNVLV